MSNTYNLCTASAKYAIFISILTTALISNTPNKKSVNKKFHRNPVPWWDSECDKMKRLRRAAFKKWRFSNKIEDYITYKKNAAQARRMFKIKKRQNFKNFTETINFRTNQTYVWNTTKILKNKWKKVIPYHTSENHQNQEKIYTALNKICPPWCPTDPEWLPSCQNNEFLSSTFDFYEFNTALSSKNSRSACGMDGIDYDVLQKLPVTYKLILLDIFNEMYLLAHTPQTGKNLTSISLTNRMEKVYDQLALLLVFASFMRP